MKEVPQINPVNWLSYDYKNEFQFIVTCIHLYERGKQDIYREMLKRFPIKHYTERFSPSNFSNVVNERNREGIKKLEIIVNSMNYVASGINNKQAVIWQFKSLIDEAVSLIDGKKADIF